MQNRALVDDVLSSQTPTPANSSGLPPGWEMRYTPNGRPYYVDHTYVYFLVFALRSDNFTLALCSGRARLHGVGPAMLRIPPLLRLAVAVHLVRSLLDGKCDLLRHLVYTSVSLSKAIHHLHDHF